jgi:hypothetical protein
VDEEVPEEARERVHEEVDEEVGEDVEKEEARSATAVVSPRATERRKACLACS